MSLKPTAPLSATAPTARVEPEGPHTPLQPPPRRLLSRSGETEIIAERRPTAARSPAAAAAATRPPPSHVLASVSQPAHDKQKPTSAADVDRLHTLLARDNLLPRGKFAPSTLHLADGRKLYMSNTLERGGFGKYRLGVMDGRDWGVKELHTPAFKRTKKPRSRSRQGISITPNDEALAEIKLLQSSFVDLKVDSVIAYQGRLYLLMEPMRGDMHQVTVGMYDAGIKAEGRLQISTLALADSAKSLTQVHAAGWVHRDIKPANLLVSATGEVRVGDWGLAAHLAAGQSLGDGIGTANFAAPEVWQAGRAPKAGGGQLGRSVQLAQTTDIWSLGMTFASLITGETIMRSPQLRHLQHGQRLEAFSKWHARLPRLTSQPSDGQNGGSIDIDRLSLGRRSGVKGQILDMLAVRRSSSPFTDHFNFITSHFGADTTSFLLDEMLHPDPHRRASAAAVEAWTTARLGSLSDIASTRALLAQVASVDPKHDAHRAALRHFSTLDFHS